MCRIALIFGTLKDESLLIDIFASNNYFIFRNILQNGVNALSKKMTPFRQKAEIFILFGLSDNDQFRLACGINSYFGIKNGISDYRCQHFQQKQEIPFWNINFLHGFLRVSSFMSPLLLLRA